MSDQASFLNERMLSREVNLRKVVIALLFSVMVHVLLVSALAMTRVESPPLQLELLPLLPMISQSQLHSLVSEAPISQEKNPTPELIPEPPRNPSSSVQERNSARSVPPDTVPTAKEEKAVPAKIQPEKPSTASLKTQSKPSKDLATNVAAPQVIPSAESLEPKEAEPKPEPPSVPTTSAAVSTEEIEESAVPQSDEEEASAASTSEVRNLPPVSEVLRQVIRYQRSLPEATSQPVELSTRTLAVLEQWAQQHLDETVWVLGAEEAKDYEADLKQRLSESWRLPGFLSSKNLHAKVRVSMRRDGGVIEHRFEKWSGNPVFDNSIVRLFDSIKMLPALPKRFPDKTYEFGIEFSPQVLKTEAPSEVQ